MTKLILHIGSPKSGTTALQRHFFQFLHRDNKINYLGKNAQIERSYDFDLLMVNDYFHEFIRQLKTDKLNVLSDETFSTSWSRISFPEKKSPYTPQTGLPIFLKKIVEEGVKVEVVIVKRNLEELILREYVQGYGLRYQWHSKTNTYKKYRALIRDNDTCFSKMFDYDGIASCAIAVIGKENYHELKYTKTKLESDFCKLLCNAGMDGDLDPNILSGASRENITLGNETYLLANRQILLSLAVWFRNLLKPKYTTNGGKKSTRRHRASQSKVVTLINKLDRLVPAKKIYRQQKF